MAISQKLIKIIAFRLCHFEDIDAEIECHPLESDTRGGPPPSPPRSYATATSTFLHPVIMVDMEQCSLVRVETYQLRYGLADRGLHSCDRVYVTFMSSANTCTHLP